MNRTEKRRVFVVDDETTIASTLALVLQSHGFDAVPFTDPREALYAAEVRCPDVLLTDVMMPQSNGIDLGVQFKAIYPDCKVLLFSGAAATAEIMKGARAQGHDFRLLSKPIHPKSLVDVIEQMTT